MDKTPNALRCREYYQNNKQNRLQKQKEYYYKNREERLQYAKENKQHRKEYMKFWQKENKEKVNAVNSKYRATKLKATPSWLTKHDYDNIEKFYKLAKAYSFVFETVYHVDHIIPLKGKTVCGLHVPWNLQLLTATENISKGNKLQTKWEDSQQ